LSNSARKNRTVGSIVTVMAVDVQRFQDITTYVMLIWSAPFQMILALFFLWRLLGFCVLIGLIILILLIPLNSFISSRTRKCRVIKKQNIHLAKVFIKYRNMKNFCFLFMETIARLIFFLSSSIKL
jgi:multidrug efflux pump subunit AcrB